MNQKPSPMKMARLAMGLSLRDVATVMNVSNQCVSLWELGKRSPDRLTLQRLARMYRVKAKDLRVDVANTDR